MSIQIFGLPVSRGVAIGRAVLVAASRIDVAHYFVKPNQIAAEVHRLVRARDIVVNELTTLKADLPDDAPHELAALLDVHLMLLNDDALAEAMRQWVEERHYNAEWALSAQVEVLARQFDEMEDEYLRERKADIEQVAERVLRALNVEVIGGAPRVTPIIDAGDAAEGPLVLVAGDIAPADMLQFKGSVFRGFVTDVGGRTSHTAIVARSLDIPAVVGAREASRLIRPDDWIVIDGEAGVVVVDPSPIVLEEYRHRQRQNEVERARLDRLRHTPSVTLDGQVVELLANIELPEDAEHAVAVGAVGVGLFRTEFLFMHRAGDQPSEEEQFQSYKKVVQVMGGLPVTIRTVDVGADKPLERMTNHELRHEHTLNPAMGLRAIRWSLSEPTMFRQQLRAVLRAAAYGRVRLLIPMVAHRSEAVQVMDALERARQQLTAAGHDFGKVEVGAMVEVPAAAVSLNTLLPYFDFVSVGTNDLIQYTLAIDRADEAVAHLFDPWHPAVLRLLWQAITTATRSGHPVSVCGEMAGDTAFTELLLAMGLRSFSMHPAQVSAVKQRLLRADTNRLAGFLEEVLAAEDPQAACARLMSR